MAMASTPLDDLSLKFVVLSVLPAYDLTGQATDSLNQLRCSCASVDLFMSHNMIENLFLTRQVRDMPDGSAIWIAKPSITNQAAGICVFDRVATLQAAVEAAEDLHEWVVQR